jgi:hypothetical protein
MEDVPMADALQMTSNQVLGTAARERVDRLVGGGLLFLCVFIFVAIIVLAAIKPAEPEPESDYH